MDVPPGLAQHGLADLRLRYREAAALRALNAAKQVGLTGSVTPVSRAGDRRELTALIRNQGSAVAARLPQQ
ncbi:hypothetical protein ACIRJO_28420 [Streptomyces sp. NPDC102394]|uniref:hypothetical protein n=1 Tax=Streptomyces sp. NPDC102394 TaxID=3366167 RepID=UPI0038069697